MAKFELSITDAKLKLRELLQSKFPDHKVDVSYWKWEHAGIRISEISLFKDLPNGGSGGWAYFQGDPACSEVIYCAERYILDLILGEEDGGEAAWYAERLIKAIS